MFIGRFLIAIPGINFIFFFLPLFLFVTLIESLERVYIPNRIVNLILLIRIKNFLVTFLFHNKPNENRSCYHGLWEI